MSLALFSKFFTQNGMFFFRHEAYDYDWRTVDESFHKSLLNASLVESEYLQNEMKLKNCSLRWIYEKKKNLIPQIYFIFVLLGQTGRIKRWDVPCSFFYGRFFCRSSFFLKRSATKHWNLLINDKHLFSLNSFCSKKSSGRKKAEKC